MVKMFHGMPTYQGNLDNEFQPRKVENRVGDVGTVPARVKPDKPRPEVRIATSIQGFSFGDTAAKVMHAAGDRKPID